MHNATSVCLCVFVLMTAAGSRGSTDFLAFALSGTCLCQNECVYIYVSFIHSFSMDSTRRAFVLPVEADVSPLCVLFYCHLLFLGAAFYLT